MQKSAGTTTALRGPIFSAALAVTCLVSLLAILPRLPLAQALQSDTQAQPRGVESTWGLEIIDGIVADRANSVIAANSCQLDGFINDLPTPYRTSSVRRVSDNAKLTATITATGTFYPGFVFYDPGGDERIRVSVDGIEKGIAVADWNNNRQRLFFLSEPLTFRGGEKLQLSALNSTGNYRMENLVLLRKKPAARTREYAITDLSAELRSSGSTMTAAVNWVTTWPAVCSLEWSVAGASPQLWRAEDRPFNNHRFVVTDITPKQAYRYRVTAKAPDGTLVATNWRSFTAEVRQPVFTPAKRINMPLKVEDAVKGNSLPVTSGVPIPRGMLSSDQQIRLRDARGNEMPLQTEVLGRWDDGSIKWVLTDFVTDQPSHSLELGGSRRTTSSSLKVTRTTEGVTIDTGTLRFTAGTRRSGLLESVSLNGTPILTPEQPGGFYLTASDGSVYTTLGPPDSVVVENEGPVRATVRITGAHRASDGRKLMAYDVRLHAFAGKPFLRIQHTFTNTEAAESTTIKSLMFRLPLSASGSQPKWTFGGAKGNHSGNLHGSEAMRLFQRRDDRYSLTAKGGGSAVSGTRAEGWSEWSDGQRRVSAGVVDFWQNYPKDLSIGRNGLEVGLCPPLDQQEYSAAKGTSDEHRLYYYLQNGVYKFRQGLSKTHDIWLDFGTEPGVPAAKVNRLPMRAVASPNWYIGSKALGELAPVTDSGLIAEYESDLERAFRLYLEDREKKRLYGMLNFGDWYGEDEINWGNSEYDTQHAFLLQFARTADLRFFRAAEQMEWHNRDIDTIHAHNDKSRIGGVYYHSIGHTGGYYEDSPVKGHGFPKTGLSVDHTYIEGHLDYYFLTGDRRSLDTARSIATRFDTYDTVNYDFYGLRVPGWHLIFNLAMYDASHDKFHLNAAKIIVERVLERQSHDGCWRMQLIPGYCEHKPPHHGEPSMQLGVLLIGLKRYHQITRDDRVAQAIIRGARFAVDDLYMPDLRLFRYTSCPATRPGDWPNFLVLDGLTYAYLLSKDPKVLSVLRTAETRFTDAGDTAPRPWSCIGKDISMCTRNTPRFIGELARIREKNGTNAVRR